MRLAARLGGSRLSRWLGRAAIQRGPLDPKVRYFTSHILLSSTQYFDHIRQIETTPELEGADPETQASWLGSSAVLWASLRNFSRAHECLSLARKCQTSESWIFSCESDVFACEDRWLEALKSAEASWEINPGAPYAARSLAGSLLNLRRVEQAASRLAEAAESGESYEIAITAAWYLCASAETCVGDRKLMALSRAKHLANRASILAPLADREAQAAIARAHLDVADVSGDRHALEQWAKAARSPFHRKVLQNLQSNPDGFRIRLPFLHSIQKHNECLPTSIASAMAAMGFSIDVDAMAAELTFGGTPEWAVADWLQGQGYAVRFFVATHEVTRQLIRNGFAFVITLENDGSAHAVAVVGLDEAAGTILVHDPGNFRSNEYLLEYLAKSQAPLAPRAMVAVTPDRTQLLDQLLPPDDVATISAREAHRKAEFMQGPEAAREIVARIGSAYPFHPNTQLLQALQDHSDGKAGSALAQFQALLERFPAAAYVRANLLACCRSLRNTSLMRKVLADVVERGILPGVESQQQWRYPPPDYVSEYADLLRQSGATITSAKVLLLKLLARAAFCASAWHDLADLLWKEGDREGALLCYRTASNLADRNEHYSSAYADALRLLGREPEGLAWLRLRAEKFGSALEGAAPWTSLIAALEDAGYPEQALSAAENALVDQGDSPQLLGFLVAFQARMGRWSQAETLLRRLEKTGNTVAFHEASARYHSMSAEPEKAFHHASAWLELAPLSMAAREQLVDLIAKLKGHSEAIRCARTWMTERPGHEELEDLYCRQLERKSYTSRQKYAVLLRRIKRNREDAWAWRELAFCAMHDYDLATGTRQQRLCSRISRYVTECDRTAPGEAPSLRVHAQWEESRGNWSAAVARWLEAMESDPIHSYSRRHLWDCAARLGADKNQAVWQKIQSCMLAQQGHCSPARDMIMLAAQRFGFRDAEASVSGWLKLRPNDPEIVEAYADLLLTHGHGRTDYQRAFELLQPELERFPFHLSLRLLYAGALQKLARFPEAEDAYREIARRHPDHTWSRIRISWTKQRRGEIEPAMRELEEAASRDPQNSDIHRAKAEILIESQRFGEARDLIQLALALFPTDVTWRRDAVNLLERCGDLEHAIQAARDGVLEYPRGAYLWLLLGRALSEHRQFAARGEIESCLRRSFLLNPGLYETADYLAMFLAEQRRYSEAEQILKEVQTRMTDPSPALGRLAWIRRRKGETRSAVEDMASLIHEAPWYDWGWSTLLEWLSEDQSWDHARRVLAQVPREQQTNVHLRQQRLELLEKAGAASELLDDEWKILLHDFHEDLSLHLVRYDSLKKANRWQEAAEVLEHIRTLFPESPYVLARWVELLIHRHNKQEAITAMAKLFYAETEPSRWPSEYSWEAVKKGGFAEEAYQKLLAELQGGRSPTPRSLSILAAYAFERAGTEKKTNRSRFTAWFPDAGSREVLKLLKMTDGLEADGYARATLLQKLSDFGYQRLVVRYWKRHRIDVEGEINSWSQLARALVALKQRKLARRVLHGWRERKGVGMWVVANYAMCLSATNSKQLREVRSTCWDALQGLAHDHCARYLVYRQAEACALLKDEAGFLDCCNRYTSYFDGKLEEGEWFETQRRYLLADLPILARHLRNKEFKAYRSGLRELRRERFKLLFHSESSAKVNRFRRWWWLIWVAFILLSQLSQFLNTQK